jgi:urease beta subunit
MIPGEFDVNKEPIELNAGKKSVKLTVSNTADRPIQVGSHYHFYEVNSKLKFDRKKAYGKRLNITPGTSVRFEPGQTRDVELVDYGGLNKSVGFGGLVMGGLTLPDDEGDDAEEVSEAKDAPPKAGPKGSPKGAPPKGDPKGDLKTGSKGDPKAGSKGSPKGGPKGKK